MTIHRITLLSLMLAATATLAADDKPLSLTLTSEATAGSGNYTPYYLVSNRHGVLDRNDNTGYMRADLEWQQTMGEWQLQAEADVIVSAHAYSTCYLQQLYASATWRWLTMSLGSREEGPLQRDFRLSSGSTLWSGNSRPIPQARLALSDYLDIPWTRGWLQLYLDISYGRCMDDDYQEAEYRRYVADKTGFGRSWITTDVWMHQKRIMFRTKPTKPWVVTLGVEHAVQFGGHTRNAIDPEMADVRYSPSFKDFFKVLIPSAGGDNSAGGDQSFVYGNHIGNIDALVEYQWGHGHSHRVGAYLENLFEDGSGMRKGNGWDGLWGLEYHNREAHRWLSGLVVEYLQTTDQSGPIHWSPHDFSGQEVVTLIPHDATGSDDYYNNYFYTGYTHFGYTCGTPMLKSPAFNADHYLRLTDTRVQAWHIGLEGELHHWGDATSCPHRLAYRVLFSTRRSWGTYYVPSTDILHSTNGLLEFTYHRPRWDVAASYAFDQGDHYGKNHALGIRLTYHVF